MSVTTMQPPLRKRLRIRDPNELPDIPVMDYLIKGLFEPATLIVIYGEPGSGKSFLALYLIYLLSLGTRAFRRRVKQAAVLYVALEGEAGAERRITAIRKRYLPAQPLLFNFITQPINLYSGVGDVEALMDAIEDLKARVVVIDTFARAIGPGSENEGADMGMMIEAFDVIRRETGAAVVIVHHCGKDRARGMRGHSSLLAAADIAIEVERTEAGRTFKIAKSKDGVDGEEFAFELEVVQLGIDQDGDPITSCVVRECEPDPDARKRFKLPPTAKAALDHLHRCICDHGVPAPSNRAIPTGVTGVTLEAWKEHLCHIGILNRDGNPREQFRRINVTLQNARAIGVYDGFVWPVT